MELIKRTVAVVVAAFLIASVATASSRSIKLELKLPPKQTFPRPEMATLLTAGPLTLDVKDERTADDPAVVGAQREKGKDVYLWRAAQPVAPAVRAMAAEILGGWSLRVAPEAELGLGVTLTSFFVTEKSETFGSTYLADVSLKVALVDRAGALLWSGAASGSAKRPGVDGRASMCNEALSMALREAVGSALGSVTPETAKPTVGTPVAPIPIEPGVLLADLTRLKSGGVSEESMVAYVEQRRLSRPLTVDELLAWKDAGIPDAAIKAAMRP